MLEPMLRTGLSMAAAAKSVSTVSSYVIGYAIAEVNFSARGGMDAPPPDLGKIAELYREKHPRYVEMLNDQAVWSLEGQFEFGLNCVGSSIGLMLMQVALGVMSVTWMCVIAVLVLGQKLLPARAAIDVPIALAIIGLGLLIIIAPS